MPYPLNISDNQYHYATMSKKKNIEPEEVLFGVHFEEDFDVVGRRQEATHVLMNPYMVDAPPLLLSSYMEYKVLLGSILERTPFVFKNIKGKAPSWNMHNAELIPNGDEYYSGVKFLVPSNREIPDRINVAFNGDLDITNSVAYLPYEITGRQPIERNFGSDMDSHTFKRKTLNAYKAQMSEDLRDYSVQPGSFLYGLKEPLSSLSGSDAKFTDYGLEAWVDTKNQADFYYGRHSSAYDYPTLANATKTRYTTHVGEGYSTLHTRAKQSFDLLETRHTDTYDIDRYDKRVATRNLVDWGHGRDKVNYSNVRPDFHYMVLRMDARYLREGGRVQYGDFLCRLLGVDFDNPDGKPIDERLDSLGVKFLNWAISEISIQSLMNRPGYDKQEDAFVEFSLNTALNEQLFGEWRDFSYISKVDAYVKLALLHSDLVRIKIYANRLTEWLNKTYPKLSETQKREFPLIPNNDKYINGEANALPFILQGWYNQKEQARDTGAKMTDYSRYEHPSLYGTASFFDAYTPSKNGGSTNMNGRTEYASSSLRMGFLGGMTAFSSSMDTATLAGSEIFIRRPSDAVISESILGHTEDNGASAGIAFSYRDVSALKANRKRIQDFGETLVLTENVMTSRWWFQSPELRKPSDNKKTTAPYTADAMDNQYYWGLVFADQLAYYPWVYISKDTHLKMLRAYGVGAQYTQNFINNKKLHDRILDSTSLILAPSFFTTIYGSCIQMYDSAMDKNSDENQLIGAIDIRRNYLSVVDGVAKYDTMSSLSAFIPASCYLAMLGSIPYRHMKLVLSSCGGVFGGGITGGSLYGDLALIDPVRATSRRAVREALEEIELGTSDDTTTTSLAGLDNLGDRFNTGDADDRIMQFNVEKKLALRKDLISTFYQSSRIGSYNATKDVHKLTFNVINNELLSNSPAPHLGKETLAYDLLQERSIDNAISSLVSSTNAKMNRIPADALALNYLKTMSNTYDKSFDIDDLNYSVLIIESAKTALLNLVKFYYANKLEVSYPGINLPEMVNFSNTGIKGLNRPFSDRELLSLTGNYTSVSVDPMTKLVAQKGLDADAFGTSYTRGGYYDSLGKMVSNATGFETQAGTIFEGKKRPRLLGKEWYLSELANPYMSDALRLHTTSVPFASGAGDNYRLPLSGNAMYLTPSLVTHATYEGKNHERAFSISNQSYYKTATYNDLLNDENVVRFFKENEVIINKQIFLSQPYSYKDDGSLDFTPFVFNSLLHSAIEYGDTFRWKTANNVPVELSLRNGENSLYEIYSRTYGRKTPLLIPSYKRKGYSDTIGEYMLISAFNKTSDVDNTTIWSHVNPKPINSVSVPFVKYGWDVQNLERWTTQENFGNDLYNDVKANNARSVKDHRGNYLLHYARLSPQNKNAAIFTDLFCKYTPYEQYNGITSSRYHTTASNANGRDTLHAVWRLNVLYVLYLEHRWGKEVERVIKTKGGSDRVPFIDDIARAFFNECMAKTDLPSNTFTNITKMRDMDLTKGGALNKVYKEMVNVLEEFAQRAVSLDRGTGSPMMWLSVDPKVKALSTNPYVQPNAGYPLYPAYGTKVDSLGKDGNFLLDTYGETSAPLQAVRSLGAHLLLDGIAKNDVKRSTLRGIDVPNDCFFYGFNPKDERYTGTHNFAQFHFDANNGRRHDYYAFSPRQKASGINLMDYTKESGRIIKASAFTLHTKKASAYTDFLNSPSISGGTSADMTAFKAGAVDGIKQHSPWMFSAPFKSNHSHAGVEAYGGKMYAREMETLWNPYSVKHLVGSGGTDKLNPLMMFGTCSSLSDLKGEQLSGAVVSGVNISGGMLYDPHSIKPIFLYPWNNEATKFGTLLSREKYDVFTWATIKEDYMNELWATPTEITAPAALTQSKKDGFANSVESIRNRYKLKGVKPTSVKRTDAPKVESTIYGIDILIDVTYRGEGFNTRKKLEHIRDYLKNYASVFAGDENVNKTLKNDKVNALGIGNSMFGAWLTRNDIPAQKATDADYTLLQNHLGESMTKPRMRDVYTGSHCYIEHLHAYDGNAMVKAGILDTIEFANTFYASYLARFMFSRVYVDMFPVPLEEHPAFFSATKNLGKGGVLGLQRVGNKVNKDISYSDFLKYQNAPELDERQKIRLVKNIKTNGMQSDVEESRAKKFGEYIRRIQVGSGGIGDVSVRGVTIAGVNLTEEQKKEILFETNTANSNISPRPIKYDETQSGIFIKDGDKVTLRLRVYSTSIYDYMTTDKVKNVSSVDYNDMPFKNVGYGKDFTDAVKATNETRFSRTAEPSFPWHNYDKSTIFDSTIPNAYTAGASESDNTLLSHNTYGSLLPYRSVNEIYTKANGTLSLKKTNQRYGLSYYDRFLELGVVEPWGVDASDVKSGDVTSGRNPANGGGLKPLTFGKIPLNIFHRRVSPALSSVTLEGSQDASYRLTEGEVNLMQYHDIIGIGKEEGSAGGFYQKWFSPSELGIFTFSMNQVSEDESVAYNKKLYRHEPLKKIRPAEYKTNEEYTDYISKRLDRGQIPNVIDRIYASPTTATYFSGGPALSYNMLVTNAVVELQTLDTSIMHKDDVATQFAGIANLLGKKGDNISAVDAWKTIPSFVVPLYMNGDTMVRYIDKYGYYEDAMEMNAMFEDSIISEKRKRVEDMNIVELIENSMCSIPLTFEDPRGARGYASLDFGGMNVPMIHRTLGERMNWLGTRKALSDFNVNNFLKAVGGKVMGDVRTSDNFNAEVYSNSAHVYSPYHLDTFEYFYPLTFEYGLTMASETRENALNSVPNRLSATYKTRTQFSVNYASLERNTIGSVLFNMTSTAKPSGSVYIPKPSKSITRSYSVGIRDIEGRTNAELWKRINHWKFAERVYMDNPTSMDILERFEQLREKERQQVLDEVLFDSFYEIPLRLFE